MERAVRLHVHRPAPPRPRPRLGRPRRSSRRRSAISTSASSRPTTRAPRTAPSARSARRTYVTNPGYVTRRRSSVTYYYTARDAFRTDDIRRTDLVAHWTIAVLRLRRDLRPAAGHQRLQQPGRRRRGPTVRDGRLGGHGQHVRGLQPVHDDARPASARRHDGQDRELGLRPELRQAHERLELPAARGRSSSRRASASSLSLSDSSSGAGLRPGSFFFGQAGLPSGDALRSASRAAACAPRPPRGRVPPRPAPPRPFPGAPVILVSVDTLRSDHLPAYGYTGVETPALDALRKDSILFERAWSHVPLTLPSHASMLHRARAVRPRHPRQPRLPPEAGRPDARRAPEEGRATRRAARSRASSSKGRERDLARLRLLRRRRRAGGGRGGARARPARRARDRGPPRGLARGPAHEREDLRVPPPLRAAHAVRAARALQDALRRAAVRRRDRRSPTRSSGSSSRS